MPIFDATEVSTLAYDFTGLPRRDGKGLCSGHGTIPEPSAQALAQFDIIARSISDYCPSPMGPPGQAQAAEHIRLLGAIAEIAGEEGPTRDELEELEPRALRTFFDWLRRVLKSPTGGGQ